MSGILVDPCWMGFWLDSLARSKWLKKRDVASFKRGGKTSQYVAKRPENVRFDYGSTYLKGLTVTC